MNNATEDTTHKFPQLTLSGVKYNRNKKKVLHKGHLDANFALRLILKYCVRLLLTSTRVLTGKYSSPSCFHRQI